MNNTRHFDGGMAVSADEASPDEIVYRRVSLLRLPAICYMCLIGLALSLVACGTPASKGVHSGPTVNASATQTLYAEQYGPVRVAVSLYQQEGSLASHNVNLVVQAVVTNHTTQPIWLFGTCEQPAMLISLRRQGTPTSQALVFRSSDNCPIQIVDRYHNDGPGIAPQGSQTTLLGTGNIFGAWTDWPTGAYTLTVTIQLWHQGTLSQLKQPGVLSGSALGQTVITLK